MKSAALLALTSTLMLAACSPSAPPPPKAADPVQKTVYDTQLKALQKAKDVQNVVDDQKKKQDKSLEDNGG